MPATSFATDVAVERLDVSAYQIPTDRPESDGTFAWDSTTMVLVEAHAGDRTGLGWTYGPAVAGELIASTLAGEVEGRDALDIGAAWAAMSRALRNVGQPGIGALALSAVDLALWDLKARLLELPLCSLVGRFHEAVPVYGSGGFTSYPDDVLAEQLGGWVAQGIPRVKMKIGRELDRDPHRVRVAREAIGDGAELFVDANGACTRRQALGLAERLAREFGVSWFEEPVSSDDVAGLAFIRQHAPDGMEIAAGEYGWTVFALHGLLEAGAVDVLQADVTRVGGITSLLKVDGLCKAHGVPLSCHCAPALHAHAACGCETLVHLEYFHDHVRIERMLFDGTLDPRDGALEPDLSRPGLGLELKREEAQRFAV